LSPRTRWSLSDHPSSVGESYVEHLGVALSFAGRLMLGGAACFVHAFLPFLFVKTGSSTIAELHDRMVANRGRAHRVTDLLSHGAGR
jgi:hypothetical protein